MHVGFGTQEEFLSLLKKDCATHSDVSKSRIDEREFLELLLEKMFDKSPVSFNIFKYLDLLWVLKSWYQNLWIYANHCSKFSVLLPI